MGELTRDQFEEQLLNVHVESVEVRVKSMACLRNHDAAQRATIQQLEAQLKESVEISNWYGSLVKRAQIGTKETPSLKAYIEQLEAKVKELEGEP